MRYVTNQAAWGGDGESRAGAPLAGSGAVDIAQQAADVQAAEDLIARDVKRVEEHRLALSALEQWPVLAVARRK